MQNDIYLPVEKLPVPPDKTDLMMIRLIDSSFVTKDDGTIEEFRKIYYETYFQGKKVSDGNNTIPAALVPLIFNAKTHKELMDIALQQFGFKLIREVFDENPNVFQNPYQKQNIVDTGLPLPNPTINNDQGSTTTTENTQSTDAGTTTTTTTESGTNEPTEAITPAN